jgi:hypothetical protein
MAIIIFTVIPTTAFLPVRGAIKLAAGEEGDVIPTGAGSQFAPVLIVSLQERSSRSIDSLFEFVFVSFLLLLLLPGDRLSATAPQHSDEITNRYDHRDSRLKVGVTLRMR